MEIKQFKPKSKELQKYIESYYILTHSEKEQKVSYLTFPSLFSIVGTILNAKSIISPEKIVIKSSPSKDLDASLVCRFNKPISVQYQGEIKEICIYFKPLGLNAFLEKSLESYSSSTYGKFIPFSDYIMSITNILSRNDNALMAVEIEAYWLKKLVGFKHPFLFDAIDSIHENPEVSTFELANKYKVSQKTFIKHFKTHVCKTPTEYKKILRFRKALKENQISNKTNNLTELAYIANFFDQSHMIANFKSLTGFTPNVFFNNLSKSEGDNINWIFTTR